MKGYAALKASQGESNERTVEARQRVTALYAAWGKPAQGAAYKQP